MPFPAFSAENHEYDENAVVSCLLYSSLVSSIKLTPLRKLQANGETSRTLQTAKLCYNAINIYSEKN